MKKILFIFGILTTIIMIACSNITHEKTAEFANTSKKHPNTITISQPKEPSDDFKKYWYAGQAEITSYQLTQARYGEIRNGKAILIYVTEDFLANKQVKANTSQNNNIPVLKLNATKKFTTGIYPYSIMQSSFYPVADNQHAIKISSSMQEWCGHVYAQLNNRTQYEITSHSYFQEEADQKFTLNKHILENELWTKIRINPTNLPLGNHKIIPSLAYCRLKHQEIKEYDATTTLTTEDSLSTYTIKYPTLSRSISIIFNTSFPHEIESWTETFRSGFGTNTKELTTKAIKIKRIKSDYWAKNTTKDSILRKELGLYY